VVGAALPVSGVRMHLREPTGEDQLVMLTGAGSAPRTLLAVLERLAHDGAGRAIPWPSLPALDLAAAALQLRAAWLGELIHTETTCPAPACGAPIDVSFGIGDYLAHHRPRRYRGVAAREDGWLSWPGEDVCFRPPNVDDVLAAEHDDAGPGWLAARCIRPASPSARTRTRIERALSAIAPPLDDRVAGQCPECGIVVELYFAPVEYVAAELRDASADLFADVHVLALTYHWSEAAIMAMDVGRRRRYVEMARGEAVLA
jgi:hypothetical protein